LGFTLIAFYYESNYEYLHKLLDNNTVTDIYLTNEIYDENGIVVNNYSECKLRVFMFNTINYTYDLMFLLKYWNQLYLEKRYVALTTNKILFNFPLHQNFYIEEKDIEMLLLDNRQYYWKLHYESLGKLYFSSRDRRECYIYKLIKY